MRYQEQVFQNLESNIQEMQRIFGKDGTLLEHRFSPTDPATQGVDCCLYCIDGMVNSAVVNDSIIKPVVLLHSRPAPGEDLAVFLERQVIQSNEIKRTDRFADLLRCLLYGDTVVFCEGSSQALIIGTKGFMKRGISEPGNEAYLKGPREGFTEPMLHNLAMLRRKLRTEDLRLEYFSLGESTDTACCICYLDGTVDRRVLAELRKRLAGIHMDGVLDTNYVAEMIRDRWASPFRTTGTSERPDVVASKLLEGRIAIVVDGSPVVLTVPHILLEFFQSGEDYYVNYTFATVNRILRILGFILSISTVPLYIALIIYHQELLPLPLLMSISQASQGVPFPPVLEALILLFQFDLLREAGSRTPSSIGQTLSVVGGLVIGQAAVEAKMVSAPMLIVIAFSGITGLIVPKLKASVSITRLILLLAVTVFGIYGYVIGLLLFLCYLASLSSFGIPMLSALPLAERGSPEDSYVRLPFQRMKKFGRFLSGRREWRT